MDLLKDDLCIKYIYFFSHKMYVIYFKPNQWLLIFHLTMFSFRKECKQQARQSSSRKGRRPIDTIFSCLQRDIAKQLKKTLYLLWNIWNRETIWNIDKRLILVIHEIPFDELAIISWILIEKILQTIERCVKKHFYILKYIYYYKLSL